MAEISGFFNAQLVGDSYDRTYLAEDYAEYFASFIGNGVYPDPATNLQLTASGDMRVSLQPGKAWLNGYYYANKTSLAFTLGNADGVLNRIDSLVIRWDKVARVISAVVKKGSFSVAPVAPAVTRTADIFEIQVATVFIKAGIVAVTQADISDTRMNGTICGIVSGVVDQIDTTGLFAQYENTFQSFMDSIQSALSDDVAGNLLNLINQRPLIKIIPQGEDVPIPERTPNTFYLKITDTQSGGVPESIRVSPNMGIKVEPGKSKSGINFN